MAHYPIIIIITLTKSSEISSNDTSRNFFEKTEDKKILYLRGRIVCALFSRSKKIKLIFRERPRPCKQRKRYEKK